MDDMSSDLVNLEICRQEYIKNINQLPRTKDLGYRDLGYSSIPMSWTDNAFYRFNIRWSLPPLKDFFEIPEFENNNIGFLAQTLFTTMNTHNHGYCIKRQDKVDGSFKQIEDFLVLHKLVKIEKGTLKYNQAAHAYAHFITMWVQKAYSTTLGMNGTLPPPEKIWVFDKKNDYTFKIVSKI